MRSYPDQESSEFSSSYQMSHLSLQSYSLNIAEQIMRDFLPNKRQDARIGSGCNSQRGSIWGFPRERKSIYLIEQLYVSSM